MVETCLIASRAPVIGSMELANGLEIKGRIPSGGGIAIVWDEPMPDGIGARTKRIALLTERAPRIEPGDDVCAIVSATTIGGETAIYAIR